MSINNYCSVYISDYIINPPKNVNDYDQDLDINKTNESVFVQKGKEAYDNKLTNEEIQKILVPYTQPIIMPSEINNRVRCIKQIICSILKQEDNPCHWIFPIITTCNNMDSVELKKILLTYWEIIFNVYNSGEYLELKDMIVMIVNSLKNEMLHSNEYLRARYTKLVGKLRDVDILIELVPTIITNTNTDWEYVNTSAMACLVEISAIQEINSYLNNYYDYLLDLIKKSQSALFRRDCLILLFSLNLNQSIILLKDKAFMSQLGEIEQTAVLNVLKHYKLLEYDDLLPSLLEIMGTLKSSNMINYDIVILLMNQSLNKLTIKTICIGFCRILKRVSDYDTKNLIITQVNNLLVKVADLKTKDKFVLFKYSKEFLHEFLESIETHNMFGEEFISENSTKLYDRMLSILIKYLVDNSNYKELLEMLEEKLNSTSRDNIYVRRCLLKNILKIYEKYLCTISSKDKVFKNYLNILKFDNAKVDDSTDSMDNNYYVSRIVILILKTNLPDTQTLIEISEYFSDFTQIKNLITNYLTESNLKEVCYEYFYNNLFMLFNSAYDYYKDPTNKNILNSWKHKYFLIITGSDFKQILNKEEQKKNDIVPLTEYMIEMLNKNKREKKYINKNLMIYTRILKVLNLLAQKNKHNFYIFESIYIKVEYLIKLSLDNYNKGNVKNFKVNSFSNSNFENNIKITKEQHYHKNDSIFDPIQFDIFSTSKSFNQNQSAQHEFMPISQPILNYNQSIQKSTNIDKLLSVKQLTSHNDCAYIESQYFFLENKEIIVEFTVTNTSNKMLENANLDISPSSNVHMSKIKHNCLNLQPKKSYMDVYILNMSEESMQCVLSGSFNYTSKQTFYILNLDYFEIDVFDRLINVDISKSEFKACFRQCYYRESFNTTIHSNRSIVLKNALEDLGLLYLKERDDYRFTNIVDEIHYITGETVFGERVYITLQFKEMKKLGSFNMHISSDNELTINNIKDKISGVVKKLNIKLQSKND